MPSPNPFDHDNLTISLSPLFPNQVLDIKREKLTLKQKDKLKKIKFEYQQKQTIKKVFVFNDGQTRHSFSEPIVAPNPFENFYMNQTFPNQRTLGMDIANTFENRELLQMLIVAPTQSGKTGAMLATLYQFLQRPTLSLPKQNIFIFTSHSSKEWLLQTRNRLPTWFANQIYHRNQLKAFIQRVKPLQNVLILFDESHIASKSNQTLYKLYFQLDLYNIARLYEKDIKLIHFTATPESLPDSIIKHWRHTTKILHMQVPANYLSIETLIQSKRVFESKDLCGYNPLTKTIRPEVYDNIAEIKPFLGIEPKLHIIRTPRGILHDVVMQNFKHVFKDDFGLVSEPSLTNFDAFLDSPVDKHTFVFIKDKLRCAKTIPHQHIGVLYERIIIRPILSSVIQGLLGRLTGYHMNHNSVVFTALSFLSSQHKPLPNFLDV